MQNRTPRRNALIIACASALVTLPALGGTTWDAGGGVDGSFRTPANWTGDSLPNLDNTGTELTFGDAFDATTLTLDGDVRVELFRINGNADATPLTFAPGSGGVLKLASTSNNSNSGIINTTSTADHTFTVEVQLVGGGSTSGHYVRGDSTSGFIIFSGGLNAIDSRDLNVGRGDAAKVYINSTATGSGDMTVEGGNSILRINGDSGLLDGNLRLRGGILELAGDLTTRGDGSGAGNIQFDSGAGLAAVGADRQFSVLDGQINLGNGSTLRVGSDNADATLHINSDMRWDRVIHLISRDGATDIEAQINGIIRNGANEETFFSGNGVINIVTDSEMRRGVQLNSGTVLINSNNTLNGLTVDMKDSTSVTGDAALLLNGAFTYTRTTNMLADAAGKATLGGYSADTATITGTTNLSQTGNFYARLAGTTVNLDGAINNDQDVTINDAFGPQFGLGQGVVSFGSNKNYTGATTVMGGTLHISNSVTGLGTSGISVEDMATLHNQGDLSATGVTVKSGGLAKGDGTYGSLSVDAGGMINAGNSPGTMIVGQLNLAADGIVAVELMNLIDGPGIGWDFYDVDELNMPGAGGNVFVDLLLADLSLLDSSFSIQFMQFQNEGSQGNLADTLFSVRDDGGQTIDGASVRVDGNGLFIDFVAPSNGDAAPAVPEPMSVLLAAAGLGAMAMRRRRSA